MLPEELLECFLDFANRNHLDAGFLGVEAVGVGRWDYDALESQFCGLRYALLDAAYVQLGAGPNCTVFKSLAELLSRKHQEHVVR